MGRLAMDMGTAGRLFGWIGQIGGLGVIFLCSLSLRSLASEPVLAKQLVPGFVTNEVRMVLQLETADPVTQKGTICTVYLENLGTNHLYVRFPRRDKRYTASMTKGKDAPIPAKDERLSQVERVRYGGLIPISVNLFREVCLEIQRRFPLATYAREVVRPDPRRSLPNDRAFV